MFLHEWEVLESNWLQRPGLAKLSELDLFMHTLLSETTKITLDCTVHRWQRLGRAGRQYVTIQSPPVLINIKIALRWFTATHCASPLKVKVASLLLPSPSALDFILCIYIIDFYSFYSTRVKDTNGGRRGAMLSTVTAHLWVRPQGLWLSQACSIKFIVRKFIALVQAGWCVKCVCDIIFNIQYKCYFIFFLHNHLAPGCEPWKSRKSPPYLDESLRGPFCHTFLKLGFFECEIQKTTHTFLTAWCSHFRWLVHEM